MARTTKQLSGAGKDKFLRTVIGAENGISDAVKGALGDALCLSVTDVRVRVDAWERTRVVVAPATAVSLTDAASAPTAQPQSAAAVAPEFDPFAFSTMALLTKQGPTVLAARLMEVATVEHLHALAKAQHLAIDAGLDDPAALRTAILAATEKRLSERRAAAS